MAIRPVTIVRMVKQLVLVRHAHRDTEVRTRDNGLSKKGQAQAKSLVSFLRQFTDEVPVRALTSPKLRCQETLAPIVSKLNVPLEVDLRLSETGIAETSRQVHLRVREFLDEWEYQGEGIWIACSHGDVLPIVSELLWSHPIFLKKAAVMVIGKDGKNLPELRWLVQKVALIAGA